MSRVLRDLVIHVPDRAMAEGLRAFFQRSDWHYKLSCRRCDFDPMRNDDLYRIGGRTDPALFQNAHEHLRPFQDTHAHALVVLDEDFDICPGAEKMRNQMLENLFQSGWTEEKVEVVVIQPELEAWLWSRSEHVAAIYGFDRFSDLEAKLVELGFWQSGADKPLKYKEATAAAVRMGRGHVKSGSALCRKVFTSRRSLEGCIEPGFLRMRQALRSWFPAPVQQTLPESDF